MNRTKLVAIVLLAAGAVGLLYGGFSYTRDTQNAEIGSIEMSMHEDRTVSGPVWVGIGAVLLGGILLFVPRRTSLS